MLLIFLIINLLSCWKLLLVNYPLAFGDLTAFPESASQAFRSFFYVWSTGSLGIFRQPGSFFPLIEGLLILFFRSPLLAQKVYLFVLPVLSYLCFSYTLKHSLNIKNKFIIFLTSTFYSFSPIVLTSFLGGPLYSHLLVFAVFPVLYMKAIDLFRSKTDLKKVLFLGFFLGIITSIYSQAIILFLIAVAVPLFVETIYGRIKSYQGWINFALIGVVTFLFNPVFFITSFNLISRQNSAGENTLFKENQGILLNNVEGTYKDISLLRTLRLTSNFTFFHYEKANLINFAFL